MKSDRAQTAPEQVPSVPRKRRWGWILSAVAAFLVLLAFLILGTPRNYRVSETPEKLELVTIQRIMQKLTASLLDKEGRFVECATVTLTPDEVNVLLLNGLRAAQPQKIKKEKPSFTASWTEGNFHFLISQPAGPLAVNLESKIVPDLRNGKLSIRVNSAWIGWIPLPPFLVQFVANRVLADLEKKKEVSTVLGLFQSIQAKDSQLEIRFYPRNLNTLFSLFLN